jgi:hypothetical protein
VRVLTKNTISSWKYSLALCFYYTFKIKVSRIRTNVKENPLDMSTFKKCKKGPKEVFYSGWGYIVYSDISDVSQN